VNDFEHRRAPLHSEIGDHAIVFGITLGRL
jgi:hypothetical protein